MAAYAALLSLAQTTDLNTNPNKYLLSSDAKEKLKSIHAFLLASLTFLDDFPEKVNRWEGKIRDAAHKIEDITDLFVWQKMELSYRRMHPTGEELEDLLDDVMVNFCEIVQDMMDDVSHAPISSSTLAPAAATSSSSSRYAPTSNAVVVGLQKDLEAIQDRLCGKSSNLQIVPIVGMGGIGKTTLARTVYENELIINHFDIRVWITVSQDYSPQRFRRILLGLLDSMNLLIEKGTRDEVDECEIALRVFQNLKGRRYLVVMDDVWSTDIWDYVRHIFPDDENGSRVMLTTRQSDVAAYPDCESPLHKMQFMDDSQSLSLLKQKVFNFPPELEDVGKEIARSCAGLPLAVVLVAGLLSTIGDSRASWQEIAKTFQRHPVVGDRESGEILSLSYKYLPHHLRPCFLYIGGFQEDAKVLASTLTKLWVAEGFLKQQTGSSQSLEEVAEQYLEDLVKRNLVIASKRNRNGKIKSCSLHDMVRDLCIRKAREEKFLRVMDERFLPQGMIDEPSDQISHIDYIWDPNIRTILGFQLQNFPSWFLGRFRLLRVLDTLGGTYEELPLQVFELFHLRYLALHCFLRVPSSISNLVNLQSLIIRPTLRYRRAYKNAHFSLPSEIWRMPQLRHLVFYDLYMLPHPPDGSNLPLENLQTLSPIENLVWNLEMVQMIPNVKKLRLVYTINNHEYNLHYLKLLLKLEKLEVLGYLGFSWRGKKPSFPWTLQKLSLVGGGFPWEDMVILGCSLPKLQVLKLINHACDGETWTTADEEFPELEYLLIDKSCLRLWTTESSPLPRLKCLVLRCCENLTEIPEALGEISTLELIEVDSCARSVTESAKLIEKNQQSAGNDALKVRSVHHHDEEIQSRYKGMNSTSVELEYQLKNVEEKIGLIATELMYGRPTYQPDSISSSSRLAPTAKGAVIGMRADLKAIKDRLCGPSSELQTIPIVGKGGIGKTTLATTVYDDPLIMRHFQIRAWARVSQNFTPQEILLHLVNSMEILEEQISLQEYGVEKVCKNFKKQILEGKLHNPQIEKIVCDNLKDKRYLIVMDDIPTTEVWDYVRKILPDDGNGSRIMLTTRQLDVIHYHFFGSDVHDMGLMDDYQSLDLLKQIVFINDNCPPDLENYGKEIARSCVGLPLAVVLVAGILSPVNKTPAFWEEIAKNVNHVADRSLEVILNLSYNHLPHHLRPCFLFIGGFPGYANIRASRLVKLLVAEGFLEHQNECSKSLEDEAQGCLEDLVERNLIIATNRTSGGRIKSCRLHDMVRDFCIRKAEEEKFVNVFDRCVLSHGMINERRISFSGSDIDNMWGPYIHTILCFHLQNTPIWAAFSGGFRLLRAFDNSHKDLPSQVFELFNLRYLALNASLDIPSTISSLANLQTLIMHPTSSPQKRYDDDSSHFSLPVEIWSLRHLRHIIFYDPCTLPHPPGISNIPLYNLQTLWRVKNLEWTMEILRMIPKVKKLGLAYIEVNNSFEDYGLRRLLYLDQLEKLKLLGSYGFSWRRQNLRFPLALKKLSLVGGVLPWADMGIIGSLPNLQVLKLLNHVCDDETWETATNEFPELEFLQIEGSYLSQWITWSSHFPRLKSLVIGSCRFLMEIPQGIADIPTLEFIQLENGCSESLVRSANQIKRDQQSKGNHTFQVRRHFTEIYEELDERPIEELQSAEREAQVLDVATVMETAEIRGTIFRRILEKTRVICNRVAQHFSNPFRRR